MLIDIKEDIEKEYKDVICRGFSVREMLFIVSGAASGIGVIILLWLRLGLPLETCVYAGIPVMIPFMYMGFYNIQGMSPCAYLKEMIFCKCTETLLYDAGEIPQNNSKVLPMNYKKTKQGARKR